VAEAWGWRAAFFLSAAPGLLLALALAGFMRRDAPVARSAEAPGMGVGAALAALWRIPNMRLALAVAGLFTAWLAVQNSFLALYLVQAKGLTPQQMGVALSMGGIAAVIGGLAFPALSDRIGRKPVCVIGCFAGVFSPLALLWLPGDPVLLAGAILIGWLPLGIAPLYCAVIPSESVPPALTTSAIGLSMGVAELLGGVVAPFAAGQAADAFGLAATLWLCLGCAVAAGVFALGLRETAPVKGVAAQPRE
jgi:predicted MFS family arabinose efflux permease